MTLFLGIGDVLRRLVPPQRLFVVHGMIGLFGRGAAPRVDRVLAVDLPAAVLLVADCVLLAIRFVRGRRLFLVEPAAGRFAAGVGALVAVGGVGRLLRGGGSHLLGHGAFSF